MSWEAMERNALVRECVHEWQRLGLVSRSADATIDELFPDPRRIRGVALRVLLFVLTAVAAVGAFALAALVIDGRNGIKVLCLLFGLGLAGLCEWRVRQRPRSITGIEAASSALAISFLVVALLALIEGGTLPFAEIGRLLLLFATLLFAFAAWRWGHWPYGACAAIALWSVFTSIEHGRLWLLLLTLIAAPVLLRLSESRELVPAQRRAADLALAVTLLASYASVNLVSLDAGWLEELVATGRRGLSASPGLRSFSMAATALFPALLIALGVGTRRLLFLRIGLLLAVASLASIRYYLQVAPAWIVLGGSGLLSLFVALAFRRWLDAGPDHERHGFTAEPAFRRERIPGTLRGLGVMATFAPAAAPVAASTPPGFEGGGGRAGGGGASGEF